MVMGEVGRDERPDPVAAPVLPAVPVPGAGDARDEMGNPEALTELTRTICRHFFGHFVIPNVNRVDIPRIAIHILPVHPNIDHNKSLISPGQITSILTIYIGWSYRSVTSENWIDPLHGSHQRSN
jgi:hypothetical protein